MQSKINPSKVSNLLFYKLKTQNSKLIKQEGWTLNKKHKAYVTVKNVKHKKIMKKEFKLFLMIHSHQKTLKRNKIPFYIDLIGFCITLII